MYIIYGYMLNDAKFIPYDDVITMMVLDILKAKIALDKVIHKRKNLFKVIQ